ncbi:MAG: chain-length determining protein [Prevotellaceae bacterium]|jgi:uncharacterized protein involved in exopolysaccharide biosynthesis|nr:chain-length determining protein [Prevotellaceae bacterium]
MADTQITPNMPPQEAEIDLLALAKKVWDARLFIIKWVGVAILVGLVVAFSIPKEYETSVMLAPESKTGSGVSGSLGSLGALVGINMNTMTGADALSSTLYPDIVKTTPFMAELFTVPVFDLEGKLPTGTTLYNYMKEEQRAAWWSYLTAAPFKVLGWVLSIGKEKKEVDDSLIDPLRLTAEQTEILGALTKRITVNIDNKTNLITVSVSMQDPQISAAIADTVTSRLQDYITNYRTDKARNDLEFTEKIYLEAQEKYYHAQQVYAQMADQSQNVVRRSYQTELDRLQNEVTLTYGVYNNLAQQLQVARAKVQEVTPVFTVVQPAVVPVRAASPRKVMILIGFAFLAGVAAVAWVLFGKELIDSFKNQSSSVQ